MSDDEDAPGIVLPAWWARSARDIKRGLLRSAGLGLLLGAPLALLGGPAAGISGACFALVMLPLAVAEGRARQVGLPRIWLALIVAAIAGLALALAFVQHRYLGALLATQRVDSALLDTAGWLPQELQRNAAVYVVPWLLASNVLIVSTLARSHEDGSWGAINGLRQQVSWVAGLTGAGVFGLALAVFSAGSGSLGLADLLAFVAMSGLCFGLALMFSSLPLLLALQAVVSVADGLEARLSRDA